MTPAHCCQISPLRTIALLSILYFIYQLFIFILAYIVVLIIVTLLTTITLLTFSIEYMRIYNKILSSIPCSYSIENVRRVIVVRRVTMINTTMDILGENWIDMVICRTVHQSAVHLVFSSLASANHHYQTQTMYCCWNSTN